MNDHRIDVAIIGGGISGLAAAYELQQRGVSVRVLEASSRPGGVIRTDRFDGWVIDGGPDALLVQKPAAVALCRELGLSDRLISTQQPRTAYVLRDGELVPLAQGSFLGFPISLAALAMSSLFTWPGKLRMAAEIAIPRGDGRDESIASFVERRFGREAVDYLAEPLLAGIHAGDADDLSIAALFPRLLDAERQSGSVLRAMRALHVTPSPEGAFVSLPGGVGELVDALAANLGLDTVQLSARITGIARSDRYLVQSEQGTIAARCVIICTPAYVTAEIVRPFDASLAALCEGVTYASTATVAVGYRRSQIAHPLNGTGFVVPRVEQSPLLAATWVTSKWPGRAPADCALLRGFLGGGRDPDRVAASDEELIQLAREELTGILDINGDPLVTRLYRFDRQSPQYTVGHLDRVAAIEQRIAALPGLYVAGSGFRAIGIPDCIADARATAGRATDYLRTL
jgi:oxygen-dependent protoporphyrinogen oxidase